jgi:lysophospholipase L1-like esterase
MRLRWGVVLLLAVAEGLGADALPQGAQPALARIEAPQALSAWTAALQSLSQGARSTVSVLHFGDSHLQAGQMDAVLRRELQARYGDAGRGFVFPYEAALTSNPEDLASASDVDWGLRRMMGEGGPGPVGAGGLAALARSVPFVLSLAQRRTLDNPAGFDRVRVFYEPGPDRAELWVATRQDAVTADLALRRGAWRTRLVKKGDTFSALALEEGVSQADLKRWNGPKLKAGQVLRLRRAFDEEGSRLSGYTVWGVLQGDDPAGRGGVDVDLGEEVQEAFIVGTQAKGTQVRAEIQGVDLERSRRSGILWHTLAANGAQAKHFSALANLGPQVAALAPDLIIVSLGTNETQQAGYDEARCVAENRHFWRRLKALAPRASLLICSPPDAAKGQHRSNPHLDGFVRALREAALQEGAAFLDLRAAQGGAGAYQRWREAGLTAKDGVHYRSAGYQLLGRWLLNALQGVGAP